MHQSLRRYFGFENFLDNQEETVSEILTGGDLCVIMPTGAGKSLCYQLPILMRPGYGIVVSPLISLMKDQVDSLRDRGIAAAFINTTVPVNEQFRILDEVAGGGIKLLYVAPERFQTGMFSDFLDRCPPATMIIDEAHCISQWGHDFRPSYLRLGEVIQKHAIAQVCAFTATATPTVREDITVQLRRPDMKLLVAGFKRPNLAFSVVDCSSNAAKNQHIRKLLANPAPTIIYASTRKVVEQLVEEFQCIGYHAGMNDEERTTAQERFMNDACPVLAATNAFGMGIDRPDVRRVIHYNITGSLEAYYQEAGRAGRDGEAAECILLYAYSDRFVQEFLIDLNNPPETLIRNLYKTLLRVWQHSPLEMTLSELAQITPEAKSENQIGSAMGILEKYGYVSRGFRRENEGKIRFTRPLDELMQQHAAQATQRSRFICRCINVFGDQLLTQVSGNYDRLAAVAGLNTEQIKRVLKALDGDCLVWTPPFGGRITELLKPDETELNIDFAEINRKHEFEIERLDEVIQYTQSRKCRQRFLISYFGEDSEEWQCGSCDRCDLSNSMLRQANDHELKIAREILEAVSCFNGRLGSGRLSLILVGSRRAEVVERGFDRSPCFGVLAQLKQNVVLNFMKNLEREGFLHRVGDPEYPCLGVTRRGHEAMQGTIPIQLDFPEIKSAASKPEPKSQKSTPVYGGAGGSDDLFDKLRELRKKVAQRRGVPAFQVLSNETLAELADKRPVTIPEAMQIKGIGPTKARTIVPEFLELISEWRRREF